MKALIIYFSPTGNTRKVSLTMKEEFEKQGVSVDLMDITRNKELLNKKGMKPCLEKNVSPHDILLIGGPVYAHHFQYYVKDVIKKLPAPDTQKWGQIAIPFVTYGGITSGVALEEGAKLLKKSGRKVIGGLKVSASHKMTRGFMPEEFNKGKPGNEILPPIQEMVKKIKSTNDDQGLEDITKKLCYRPRSEFMKVKIIFNEKLWHNKLYPKIKINKEKCVNCGKCVKNCPVFIFESLDGKTRVKSPKGCVHCFNCIVSCPVNAIGLEGNVEKGREFMNKAIREKGNRENPPTCFYT